jgi:hypothetical protein
MLSLKTFIGTRSDSYREEVTSDRIQAFCKAIGIEDRSVAPPTFLTVFRKGEFELFQILGIELSKVLHAEQEYQYEHPIRGGDFVHFQTVVSQILEKNGSTTRMQFFTFETEILVEKGSDTQQRAGKSKTTIVIREKV